MNEYGPKNTLLERFSFKKIRNSILLMLNLEKGIGYTLVNLAIRPGHTINTYLFENRTKMVKPIGFLVFTISIATFLTVNFMDLETTFSAGFNQGLAGSEKEVTEKASLLMNQYFAQYFNIMNFLGVPLLAFGSFALYSKYLYNYAEHLVISAYLTSFNTVLYILLFPIFVKWYMASTLVYMIIVLVYLVFAFKQIFKESWGISFAKGVAIQMIYYTLLSVLMLIISIAVGIYLVVKMKGEG